MLGGGHLRHGLGVPARVARLRPGVEQVEIGFVTVREGAEAPALYAAPLEHEGTRFAPDYALLWFTPPPPDPAEDPCAVFKRLPHASG